MWLDPVCKSIEGAVTDLVRFDSQCAHLHRTFFNTGMKKSKELVAEWDLEARRNLRKVPRLSIPSSSATDGFCISDNPLDCTTSSMAPHTPYRDLCLNSRPQQCNSAEGGGSTSSVDSRRVWDSSGSQAAALGRYGDWKLSTEPRKIDDCTVSEDRGWSADDCTSQCQKRLKRTSSIARGGDDHTTMAESDTYPEVDDTTPIRTTSTATTQDFGLPVTSRKSSHPKGEAGGVPGDDEADMVLHAASALVSLSTDSRRLASARRRTSSPSSASTSSSKSPSDEAVDEEFLRPSASVDVAILSNRNSGSGSSVLSRPSHKQRYRLVAAVLAASPRIGDS
ncbi:uncharacterized protein [Physcomitrium patens]|nr:uncharacterized protein LOC112280058 isoform X1 [Physcomitrium patens]|eukprot:XP_024370767.1 uncharacterized protein LOC112280058 isoform X1 [Physcomitrella patens]